MSDGNTGTNEVPGGTDAPLSPPAPPTPELPLPAWVPLDDEGPWLDARQLADKVGRDKRTVLLWLEELAPYGRRVVWESGRKQKKRHARLAVIKAYMASRALVEGSPHEARAKDAAPAVEEVDEAAREHESAEDKFRARVLAELERELQYREGAIDYDATIARARKAFDDLMRNPLHPLASVAERDKWMSANERCARILRDLDKARHEAQLRIEKWIDRDVSRRMLVSQAQLFDSDGKSLANDMPKAIVEALAEFIDPARMDEARRIAMVHGRQEWDRVAANIATRIREQVDGKGTTNTAVGREAPGSGIQAGVPAGAGLLWPGHGTNRA